MTLTAEAASALVARYLQARCEYETKAYNAFDVSDKQGQDVQLAMVGIRVAYRTLQRTYCTPSVVALKLRAAFGNPPSVNPDGVRVQGIRRRGDALIVTTLEEDWEPPAGPPDTVQYVVELVDGRPLLADRRVRTEKRSLDPPSALIGEVRSGPRPSSAPAKPRSKLSGVNPPTRVGLTLPRGVRTLNPDKIAWD